MKRKRAPQRSEPKDSGKASLGARIGRFFFGDKKPQTTAVFISETPAEQPAPPPEHKLTPLHIFHNEEIDRWVVLMSCRSCERMHVFYPFK